MSDYSKNPREWMVVGKFPYYNRIGRMLYDEHGRCTGCGHHADQHNRTCNHIGRWNGHRYEGGCGCSQESPRQDAESALAGAAWRAFTS